MARKKIEQRNEVTFPPSNTEPIRFPEFVQIYRKVMRTLDSRFKKIVINTIDFTLANQDSNSTNHQAVERYNSKAPYFVHIKVSEPILESGTEVQPGNSTQEWMLIVYDEKNPEDQQLVDNYIAQQALSELALISLSGITQVGQILGLSFACVSMHNANRDITNFFAQQNGLVREAVVESSPDLITPAPISSVAAPENVSTGPLDMRLPSPQEYSNYLKQLREHFSGTTISDITDLELLEGRLHLSGVTLTQETASRVVKIRLAFVLRDYVTKRALDVFDRIIATLPGSKISQESLMRIFNQEKILVIINSPQDNLSSSGFVINVINERLDRTRPIAQGNFERQPPVIKKTIPEPVTLIPTLPDVTEVIETTDIPPNPEVIAPPNPEKRARKIEPLPRLLTAFGCTLGWKINQPVDEIFSTTEFYDGSLTCEHIKVRLGGEKLTICLIYIEDELVYTRDAFHTWLAAKLQRPIDTILADCTAQNLILIWGKEGFFSTNAILELVNLSP